MIDLDEPLSPHFTLREMVHSDTAQRRPGLRALQESPPAAVIESLRYLCLTTLEPLRRLLGGWPIRVTSGYRCPELNRLVGGVPTSQHLVGQAADLKLAPYQSVGTMEARTRIRDEIRGRLERELPTHPAENFFAFARIVLSLVSLDVDQVIHEFGAPGRPAWVHVSAHPPQGSGRREILRIYSDENNVTMVRHLNVESALALGVAA